MRTGLTKREKTTAIFFDEYGSMMIWYRNGVITMAATLGLFCVAAVQIVRGIASIGGKIAPEKDPRLKYRRGLLVKK